MNSSYVVIDLETTGFSPDYGDRITEIAAVKIKDGKVTDQFESLVNTGQYIPDIVSNLNGINENMLESAPSAEFVMNRLVKFIGKQSTLIAHNASFDSRFFHNELELVGIEEYRNFICTLLLSRRLYQYCSDHKLATMAEFHNIEFDGDNHRAMPDALVTAKLFMNIFHDLELHNLLNKEFDKITPDVIMFQQKASANKFLQTAKKIYNPNNNKRNHILINGQSIKKEALVKPAAAEAHNTSQNKKIVYVNGDKYEGSIVNNKRDGFGLYTWFSGNTYQGDFVKGKLHGKGIYTWLNGDTYEGEFVNNERHGLGKFFTKSKTHFEEVEYIHDKKKNKQ